ncbi:MAG TPA: hypothetical protein VIM05_00840 [Gaiellaceae bacterium]|jgi:hypothetical protein
MARVPVLAIALLLASGGVAGFAYLKTRRAGPEAVVHVDRVAQAVASTSSEKSFTFTYSTTISAAGESLTMSGDGSYDVQHELVAMKLHFDGLPPGSPAAAANAEIVLDNSDGLVEYIQVALLDGHLPAGKSWVKVDVGELGKKAGIDLSRLQQGDSADPSRIFSLLRRSANPTVVGQENVGGVATTHYEATVDLRRLAALEADAAPRENLQRAIAVSGISSYPVEVWIDGDGYLRRMRTTIPQHMAGTPAEVATVTATEELSNFGTDARIAVPPDSSVVDISDLAG